MLGSITLLFVAPLGMATAPPVKTLGPAPRPWIVTQPESSAPAARPLPAAGVRGPDPSGKANFGGAEPLGVDPNERVPGLTVRLFQLEYPPDVLPTLVPDQTPNVDRRVDVLDLAADDFEGVTAPHFTRALGWLQIDQPGAYRLRLASDDGSRLRLDGELVIDNDGRHGTRAIDSAPLELSSGLHAIAIEHFDSGGARTLSLAWQRPGSAEFALVPVEALWCEADPTRVTSPGPKATVDNRRPGLGLPVDGVHPGWRVESLPLGGRPDDFAPQVGAMAFLPDGRLAFGTFDPLQRDEVSLPDIDSKAPDVIWALDLATDELSKIATDVFEPSGMCVVDGELYVAHRKAVTRLTDGDGDGYFETHKTVGEGWEGWNYHQFSFGLVHRDGKLYTALSTSMAPPKWEGMGTNAGPNGPLRGAFLEIDLSSGDVRAIAGGARTPNGLGLDAEGRLVYSDNQGAWMPASVLSVVEPGSFHGHYNRTNFVPKLAERYPDGGHPSVFVDRPRTPPTLWLPHGEVVNSPTEPLLIPDGPFAGQLLVGELTAGGIRRVQLDGAGGGALFRFTQGLESGVNRMEWGPDGSLYVGGIGAGGNWNWKGTRAGLQRLVPTGESAFEIASVSARLNGFTLRFTEPVDEAWLADESNYTIDSWTYAPTAEYGGPKVDVREHVVVVATPEDGGRSVRLGVSGLTGGHCVRIACDATSVGGEPLWSGECWYTLPPSLGSQQAWGRGSHWVPILNDGSAPTLRLEGAPRPSNLSGAELEAGGSPFILEPGGAEAFTTTVQDWKMVAIDYRATEPDRPLPELWVALGESSERQLSWGDNPAVVASALVGTGDASGGGADRLRIYVEGPDGASPVELIAVSTVIALPERSTGPWIDLFADADNWSPRGGQAVYALEDGVLRGESRPNTPNTFWTSRRTYADFELIFDVRVHPELNSGVQIRSSVNGGIENRSGNLKGYQVEIDPSDRAWSAGIYDEQGRGWVHPLHAAPYARRAWRQGEWNRYRVLCEGARIRTWINGVPAADLVDEASAEGHLGFQVHGVGGREDALWVEWKNVRLRELSDG